MARGTNKRGRRPDGGASVKMKTKASSRKQQSRKSNGGGSRRALHAGMSEARQARRKCLSSAVEGAKVRNLYTGFRSCDCPSTLPRISAAGMTPLQFWNDYTSQRKPAADCHWCTPGR
mmetsp:Transcript_5833/g.10502  ORF Transcript_5833/g.10502 Transcript_5833/m.10502 type:complete len:118 (-) Transcript_5833:146-499(-)